MSDDLQLEDLSVKQLLQLQVRLLASIQAQLIELNMAATPDESEECEHPEEKRIPIGALGDNNHWVCALCKFDNKAQTMN